MTVASEFNTKAYAGDNVTQLFDTTYVFFDSSDLQVKVTNNTTGSITLLVEDTNYTVTGGDGAAGTVNLGGGSSPFGALQSGTTLTILRVLPAVQEVDFVNNDNSDAEVVERALDQLTMVDQQNLETISRALRLPVGDVSGTGMELIAALSRANKVIGFDSNGALTYLTPVTAVTDGASLNWVQTGTGAQSRSVQDRLRDSVSVFDFMTAAQIADVRAGTALTDVTSAIQAAMNTLHNVYCPAGTYKITSTLNAPNRHGWVLAGEYQQTIFKCTSGGSTRILTFPTGLGVQGYAIVEGITFAASGSGAGNAVGVEAPSSYAFSVDFRYCSFKASLRKGVTGTYLMCDFYRCDWGTLTAPSGTFKAIELIGTGAFESVVSFRYCEIAGSNDTLAIEVNFANLVRFEGCVLEPNSTSTAVMQLTDVLGFCMEGCWSETNGAVPLVKGTDGAHAPVDTRFEFNRCHLEGNGSGANDVVLDVSTGTGLKSIFTNNVLVNFTHIILYAGGNYNLPGSGTQQCLAHYNNKIFGGTPGFLGTSDFDGGFANYQGTLTNDSPPAGYIGEIITATLGTGSATALTSTVGKTITSIVLTPGDWDVTGMIGFQPGVTTNITVLEGSSSLVNNTIGNSDNARTSNIALPGAGYVPGAVNIRFPIPTVPIQVAAGGTTTVFLVALATFTVSTLASYGTIRARRVR